MPKEVWNTEMVARAAGLKRAGFTNKEIAERLGVTKNAVAARMHLAKAHARLDGRGRRYLIQRGPLTLDIMGRDERVNEYLEKPEGEEQ